MLFSFWATVCKTVRPVLSVRCLSVCLSCLSCLSVTLVYCGQTVGWIKMKLGMHMPLPWRPWPHSVRWGSSSPTPKGHSRQCSAHILYGQMAAWIKIPPGMVVGHRQGDFVLDGDPSDPPPKKGAETLIFGLCLLWPNA